MIANDKEKNVSDKMEKEEKVVGKWQKIQTAEGWKRATIKKREKAKKSE